MSFRTQLLVDLSQRPTVAAKRRRALANPFPFWRSLPSRPSRRKELGEIRVRSEIANGRLHCADMEPETLRYSLGCLSLVKVGAADLKPPMDAAVGVFEQRCQFVRTSHD
jgi:hypothetical protein